MIFTMDGTQDKRGSTGWDWRGENSAKDDQGKTKEVEWTYTERRQSAKDSNRRKNGGEKNERKTTTDDARLDDGEERISTTEGEGTTEGRLATLDT